MTGEMIWTIAHTPKARVTSAIRFTSMTRKATALKKLGVSADQLARQPQITPLLKDTRGGLKSVLTAMRFSKDPVIQSFLAQRDSLGVWARENVPWEAVGVAAGIDLVHLLGAALLALREHTMTAGKLIAMCYHPEVVKKRVEYAKLPGGWRDRDAIDRLVGIEWT